MKSQWDCVLQNLGEWQGSFAHFSPQGVLQEDIPSLISLTGMDDNRAIHLVLKRFYLAPGSAERIPKEMVVDFSAPGKGALFFETGVFSDGTVYFSPQGSFGAESCLVDQNRRLRLVMLFDASRFSKLTLIREQRVGTDAPELPLLRLEDLLGEWQGQKTTRYFAKEEVEHQSTHSQLEWRGKELIQHSEPEAAGGAPCRYLEATPGEYLGAIAKSSTLEFEKAGQVYQTLLLPDGASVTCPMHIAEGKPFFLEIGWLRPFIGISENSPVSRQRLIRQYNERGEWVSLTWVTEQKIA